MKKKILALIVILGWILYASKPQLSSNTVWEAFIHDDGCILQGNSKGVELSFYYMPNLYSLSVSRPSKLNDLMHRRISWPAQGAFDLDHREEDIFAAFFSNEPQKLKLKMAHAGGGDGDISSFDKTDVYNVAYLLTQNTRVEIFKASNTWSGHEVNRLGSWALRTKADKEILISFYHCMRQLRSTLSEPIYLPYNDTKQALLQP